MSDLKSEYKPTNLLFLAADNDSKTALERVKMYVKYSEMLTLSK
jgi:hypothetical protein